MLTTNVSARGLGLHAAPFSPFVAPSKTKLICPCRLPVTRATNSNDSSSSSDENSSSLPSSSSPVPDTLPVAGIDTDWRAFRARLVASSSGLQEPASTTTSSASPSSSSAILAADDPWAHNLTTLEPGCVLLASPQYFTHSQTYFNQAVILIADHSPRGSYGFIVNKPTEYRIGAVNSNGALPEQLNPCTLYLGGDVNKDNVSIVHSVDGLEDTREIVPGVYLGGLTGLGRKMENGELTPSEVKIMVGMAGWGPGQLQEEVARGVWIVASASKHVILSGSVAGAGEDLWHMTMQLMGGDYAGLSRAVKETYRPDIMEFNKGGNSNTSSGPMEKISEKNDDDEDPRGGGGGGGEMSPPSSSSSKGPWKPPRRDPGHNYGSGI